VEIVFHIGAHCTDEGLLTRSLRLNSRILDDDGILVPTPKSYFSVLRDAMRRYEGDVPDKETRTAIFKAMLDGREGRRVILSHENLISFAPFVFAKKDFYPRMGDKARWLRNLFPDNPVEFHIALRDPASLVPAIYRRKQDSLDADSFLNSINLEALTWHSVLRDLQEGVPDCPIVTWCNEDTPLTWPEVLQAVTDHEPNQVLENSDGVLKSLLSEEGVRRMRGFLDANPPKSTRHRRQIALAFFDKYGIREALEEDVELPGWDEVITDTLSETYKADIDSIRMLANVEMIE